MVDRSKLKQLKQKAPVIAPSMLMCDFANLEREVERLEQAEVEVLHLDVMDGNFVPNLTYGFPIVKAFRKLTSKVIDVHLMIQTPEKYLAQYVEAGADSLTIHIEAVDNPRAVLQEIHSLGVDAGIALNPNTPLSAIQDCLDLCDLVLVMSVMPGFGGQSFQPSSLDKLRELTELVNTDTILQIDGGINDETIAESVSAGAHVLVVGSAIFRHQDYRKRIQQLTTLAMSQTPTE